jgi:hypothetical protein
MKNGIPVGKPDTRLRDENGPIPRFPQFLRDDEGGLILPNEEEHKSRSEAFRRAADAIALIHDESDDDDRWRVILTSLGVPSDPDPLRKSE